MEYPQPKKIVLDDDADTLARPKHSLEPKDKQFFILPFHIANDHDLSIPERMLLCMITSLDKDDHCYATNRYFADILGKSIRQIQRMILHLVKFEKIEIKGKSKNH